MKIRMILNSISYYINLIVIIAFHFHGTGKFKYPEEVFFCFMLNFHNENI